MYVIRERDIDEVLAEIAGRKPVPDITFMDIQMAIIGIALVYFGIYSLLN